MKKKGLSPIIITVLVIALSLGGVALIWSSIRGNLDSLDNTSFQECLTVPLTIHACEFNGSTTRVRIARGAGSGELTGLRFVFDTSEGEQIRDNPSALPAQLETRNYFWAETVVPRDVDVAAIVDGNTCAVSGTPRPCTLTGALLGAMQCNDGLDNDNDTLIDFGPLGVGDPGCTSLSDDDEADEMSMASCDDGHDDDGDGLVDWPIDPGCTSYLDADGESGNPASIDESLAFAWSPLLGYQMKKGNLVKMYVIGENQTRSPYFPHAALAPINPVEAAANMLARAPRERVMLDRDTSSLDLAGLIDPIIGNPNSNPADRCLTATGTPFECSMWHHTSLPIVQQRYRDFFGAFEAAGGDVQMVVYDIEGIVPSNWGIGADPNNPETLNRWTGIRDDPRFIAENLGPQLAAIGIVPDITILADVFDNAAEGRNQYQNWNAFMTQRAARLLRSAGYDIVDSDYFPGVSFSNYQFYEMDDLHFKLPDGDGHKAPTYQASDVTVGTHQAPILYGCQNQLTIRRNALPGVEYYARSPFNGFKWATNNLRAVRLSSSKPITPWIGARDSLTHEAGCFIPETDYYQETLLHALLTDVESFLFWNAYNTLSHQEVLENNVSIALREFDTVAGYVGKDTLVSDDGDSNVYEANELVPWELDYFLTGSTTAGRKVWRFTPNMRTFDDIDSFVLTDNTDAIAGTLVVRSQRYEIAFPQGVIHLPTNPISGMGLWIVQPAGAAAPQVIETFASCGANDDDHDARDDSTDAPCTRQCYDGIDNDGDGAADSNDFSCFSQGQTEDEFLAQCQDGVSNDGDGLVDVADPQCTQSFLGWYPSQDNSESS